MQQSNSFTITLIIINDNLHRLPKLTRNIAHWNELSLESTGLNPHPHNVGKATVFLLFIIARLLPHFMYPPSKLIPQNQPESSQEKTTITVQHPILFPTHWSYHWRSLRREEQEEPVTSGARSFNHYCHGDKHGCTPLSRRSGCCWWDPLPMIG